MYTLFSQLENTFYPDGSNASDYIDVISGHMDCKEEAHSEDAPDLYRSNVLKTKNFLIEMTGGGYQWLKGWAFTQGFIYLTEGCDSTDNKYRSVFRCSNTNPSFDTDIPKLVTSNYLQTLLSFPATQQPGVPRE